MATNFPNVTTTLFFFFSIRSKIIFLNGPDENLPLLLTRFLKKALVMNLFLSSKDLQ